MTSYGRGYHNRTAVPSKIVMSLPNQSALVPSRSAVGVSGDDAVIAETAQVPSRMCKFCYDDEERDDVTWLHPCRCDGSMKWVHSRCFAHWLQKAPTQQQTQCMTCKYTYKKCWVLKGISDWCRPQLRLSMWELVEIFLDCYSTYKYLRGIVWTIEGRRSIWLQVMHTFFWRTFIASNRRLSYYGNLGRAVMASIFDISVHDYEEQTTPRPISTPLTLFLC